MNGCSEILSNCFVSATKFYIIKVSCKHGLRWGTFLLRLHPGTPPTSTQAGASWLAFSNTMAVTHVLLPPSSAVKERKLQLPTRRENPYKRSDDKTH
ncbi:hypothetical protein Taro_032980 [Colocasia esculenta]|uniref:Uncharacterized protein n=1 Tax=Colocasia esculenta TaxID=4460 RepID=A0A843W0F8_COLES|nr:hypothetical protein [Colocasia esculenta]